MLWWTLRQLQSDKPATRLEAVQKLAGESGEKVLAGLISVLGDSDAEVRREAAAAIGGMGGTGSLGALEPLLRDATWDVRAAAADALYRLGWMAPSDDLQVQSLAAREQWAEIPRLGARAVEPLTRLIKEQKGKVSEAAARSLQSIRDVGALSALAQAAGDSHAETRAAAIAALRGFTDSSAVPALLGALSGASYNGQDAIIEALRDCGDPQAVEPLIALIQTERGKIHEFGVAKALGKFRDARAVDALAALLSGKYDHIVEAAIVSLAEIGDARAVEPLLPLAAHASPGVRAQVADALGMLGDARAGEPLVALLDDSDSKVRTSSLIALGKLRDSRAFDRALKLLGDPEYKVRRAAAECLAGLRDARANGALATALWDKDSEVAMAAARALAETADAAAVDAALQGLAKERSIYVNTAAEKLALIATSEVPSLVMALRLRQSLVPGVVVAALKLIGSAAARAALVAFIADRTVEDRTAVAQAIQAIIIDGDPDVEAVIVAALQNPDEWVRKEAANALGRGGSDESIPALTRALRNESGCSPEAAVALGAIGGPAAARALVSGLVDGHNRAACRTGLEAIGEDAREALLEARGRREYDQEIVEELLEELQAGPDTSELIGRLEGSEEPWIRARAARTLARRGDTAAVPALLNALQRQGNSPVVGPAIIEALGRLGDRAAVQPLIDVLELPFIKTVILIPAIAALGELGDRRAEEVIRAWGSRENADPEVSRVAQQALRQLQGS